MLRKIAARTSITVLSLLFVVVIFELYLRQVSTRIEQIKRDRQGVEIESDPRFLFEYTPNGRRLLPNREVIIRNHVTSGLDVPVSTNALGFRDDPMPQQKPAGEYRILLLGDSITIADYLPKEQTYADVLEKSLNVGSDRHINVVNAGVGDIGIKEEIDILQEKGLATQPDLVLIAFYLNDSRPSWGFQNEAGHRGWWRRHSVLIETIYHRLLLAKFMSENGAERFEWINKQDSLNWKENEADFQELAKSARFDWGSAWQDDAWSSVQENFLKLKTLSAQYNFKVAVVMFPVSFQVYSKVAGNKPQRQMSKLTNEMGFYYLDLLPVLQKEDDPDLFFDQCHPKAPANKMIGEQIAGFIKEHIEK